MWKHTGELYPGRYRILHVHSRNFLKLVDSHDGAAVVAAKKGRGAQWQSLWDVRHIGDGLYTIKNVAHGLYASLCTTDVDDAEDANIVGKAARGQFVIQETNIPGNYEIFTDDSEQYWALDGPLGAPVTLVSSLDAHNQWSFFTAHNDALQLDLVDIAGAEMGVGAGKKPVRIAIPRGDEPDSPLSGLSSSPDSC